MLNLCHLVNIIYQGATATFGNSALMNQADFLRALILKRKLGPPKWGLGNGALHAAAPVLGRNAVEVAKDVHSFVMVND